MAYRLEADRIAWSKQYYQKTRERQLEKNKDYYAKHREEIIKKNAEYAKKNWEKICEYNSKYLRNKRKNNNTFRITRNFSRGITRSLKNGKNGRSWEGVVDYNINDLMKHLESKFDNKMTWENYGSYWHIDHIKPIALFTYKSIEDKEFKECWSLENLQPLEAKKNLSKGKKYVG